ncbi:MAG TPA: phosphatase PAP2 family protein [Coxiellaceae bacterium]|nr:phosphatase PAP2 family protein [Coxiellaceae bacterium]
MTQTVLPPSDEGIAQSSVANLGLYRPWWVPTTLIFLYLLTIAILSLSGHYLFFTQSLAVSVFLLVGVFSGELKCFLFDWSIYLSLLIFLNAIRGFIFAFVEYFHQSVYSLYVIQWEKWLLNGHIAPYVAQQWLYQHGVSGNLYQLLSIFYASHFVVFLLLGAMIWFQKRSFFKQYQTAFISVMLIGITFFWLIPTMPPWMASSHQQIPLVISYTSIIYNVNIPSLFHLFNTDPIAAMPSLHAAFSVLVGLMSVQLFRTRAWPFLTYVIFLNISCIVLGQHYLVDLLAGALLATVVFLITQKLYKNKTNYSSPLELFSREEFNALVGYKIATAILILLSSVLLSVLTHHWLLNVQIHG